MNEDTNDYLERLFEAARKDGDDTIAASKQHLRHALGLPVRSVADATLWRHWGLWVGLGILVIGASTSVVRRYAGSVGSADAAPSGPEMLAASLLSSSSLREEASEPIDGPRTPSIAVDRLPSPAPPLALRHAIPKPAVSSPKVERRDVVDAVTESASAAPSVPARSTSILEEIRIIDEVRQHVRDGAGDRALRVLETYDARFPVGALREEATALRIEALERAGDHHAAAVAMGRRFLREHPDSAYASRIDIVLRRQATENQKKAP